MGLLTNIDVRLDDRYALMQLDSLTALGCGTDSRGPQTYSQDHPLFDRLRSGLADILMDYPRMQDLFMEVYRSRTLIRSKFVDRIVRFDRHSRNRDISIREIRPSGQLDLNYQPRTIFNEYIPGTAIPMRSSSFSVYLSKTDECTSMMYRIYNFLIELGIVADDPGRRRPCNISMLIHHYFFLKKHDSNSCAIHFVLDLVNKDYSNVVTGTLGRVTWNVKYTKE